MDLVGCYQANIDPEEEVIHINQLFAVPLVDASGQVLDKLLIGEIDLVARKVKKILVDWKSSAARWPEGKAHRGLQPTVYLYGSSMNDRTGLTPEFRYDIVVKNKTPVFEQHVTNRKPDAFHRMVEKVKLAEHMIASEHFFPNDESMYCKSCPFQTSCKTGHRNRATLVSVAA
jgi:putative RecB family exonuclease